MHNGKIRLNWKEELSQTFTHHPDWKAPQFQRQLEVTFGDMAPGLSSIQKALIGIRREYEKDHSPGGLDTPWHLGLMVEHPEYSIPPEALPYIFAAQSWAEVQRQPPNWRVSIRQALWIARIFPLIGGIEPDDIRELYEVSHFYAVKEITAKLSDIELNTLEIDEALRAGTWRDMATKEIADALDTNDCRKFLAAGSQLRGRKLHDKEHQEENAEVIARLVEERVKELQEVENETRTHSTTVTE